MENKIFWFSRHPLTPAQLATLQVAGYDQIEQHNLSFQDYPEKQIAEITDQKVVALVAPLWVNLRLLRSDYKIIEFVNVPSARKKGVFLCQGAFVHELNYTQWVQCPVSVDEQEESSLNY